MHCRATCLRVGVGFAGGVSGGHRMRYRSRGPVEDFVAKEKQFLSRKSQSQ
jgi:hypothetical protein